MLVHIDSREKFPDFSVGKNPTDPGILTEVPDLIVDHFQKAKAEYDAAHDEVKKFWEFARNREAQAKAKPLVNLTFHEALEHLKNGKDIARAAWGSKAKLVPAPQAFPHLTIWNLLPLKDGQAAPEERTERWKIPLEDVQAIDWKVL